MYVCVTLPMKTCEDAHNTNHSRKNTDKDTNTQND